MGKGKGKGGYGENDWSDGQWCCCGLASFVAFSLVIITITLLALSLPKVEEGQQAIRYDDVSNTLHRNILSPGIHVVQPDTKLITYPTRFEDNNIDMICRTKDGIEIELSITFQYNFVPNKLVESFLILGEREKNDEYMNYYAKAAIYETCSHHDAVNFTDSRGLIEFDMSQAVEDIMNITNTQMAQFQLRNFVYPDEFQSAVNSKQQTRQQIEVVTRQRNSTITEAQTQLIRAQQQVEIQINNANAQAERLIREADLASQTILAQWNQTILSTDAELTNIGLTFEEYVNYLNQLLIGSAHTGIVRVG
jgi:regulator of protease activity HflC (stomatin/prohibitin superfamily)